MRFRSLLKLCNKSSTISQALAVRAPRRGGLMIECNGMVDIHTCIYDICILHIRVIHIHVRTCAGIAYKHTHVHTYVEKRASCAKSGYILFASQPKWAVTTEANILKAPPATPRSSFFRSTPFLWLCPLSNIIHTYISQ